VPAQSKHLRRMLDDTGLARIVPVFAHLEEATAVPEPQRRPTAALDTAHVMDAIRALDVQGAPSPLDPPASSLERHERWRHWRWRR
jgi:hypothetical protein